MRRVVLALALSSVAGCGNDARSLWRDDFETECNGTACGWTQIAGPPGAATWIETLPSEHGISMVGAGVAIARVADGDEVQGDPNPVRSLRAHVVARCDTGSELTLIVTVTSTPSTGGAAVPLDVSGSATFPTTWDGTRSMFALLPDDGTDTSATFSDITNVVVHKSGDGACEIDSISLADADVGFAE